MASLWKPTFGSFIFKFFFLKDAKVSQNDPMSYTQSVLGVNKKFWWKANQNVTQAIIKYKPWSINAQQFTSTFPKKMRDIKMIKHVTWNIIWVEYLQPGSTSCWDILHTQQIFTSEKREHGLYFVSRFHSFWFLTTYASSESEWTAELKSQSLRKDPDVC